MKPTKHREFKFLATATVVLLVAACGGGDDGGSTPLPPPDTTQYAPAAALNHLLTQANAWTVGGKASDGHTFSISIGLEPKAPGAFPLTGVVSARTLETMTIQRDGVTTGALGQTLYFDASSLAMVGTGYGDGNCAVATSVSAIPVSARLGDSGVWFDQDELSGCSAGSVVVGRTTVQWTLESVAGIALFCLQRTLSSPAGKSLFIEADCVETAPDGTLGARARVNVVSLVDGFALDARNF